MLSVGIHTVSINQLTKINVDTIFKNSLKIEYIINIFQPGDDDYDVLEGSKFSVSRTAFRDNSSFYRINDKKSTYREVAILLRGSGIDLDHNRFLILQVG